MTYKQMEQLTNKVQPKLPPILSEFNEILRKHGISEASIIEFTLSDKNHKEMESEIVAEGIKCEFACWPCGRALCCGIGVGSSH